MTVTNNNTAAELNETQLDQVVGAGGLLIERRGNAVASEIIVHDTSVRKAGGTQTD
ncbi:hypothetical protein [Sandarakinorhabdus sp.]|uniref:hypothetical protein n=1 Tax=Sandarakinorhabdus sp. TaxID=1916663 RepID=UPI00333F4591